MQFAVKCLNVRKKKLPWASHLPLTNSSCHPGLLEVPLALSQFTVGFNLGQGVQSLEWLYNCRDFLIQSAVY